MALYIRILPIHKKCNSPMKIEGLSGSEILICSKCQERKLLQSIDINKLIVIDNKLILI